MQNAKCKTIKDKRGTRNEKQFNDGLHTHIQKSFKSQPGIEYSGY
jgi:hypothetical protein